VSTETFIGLIGLCIAGFLAVLVCDPIAAVPVGTGLFGGCWLVAKLL